MSAGLAIADGPEVSRAGGVPAGADGEEGDLLQAKTSATKSNADKGRSRLTTDSRLALNELRSAEANHQQLCDAALQVLVISLLF